MKLLEYFSATKKYAPEEQKDNYVTGFEQALDDYVKKGCLSNSIKEFKYEYFDTISKVHKPIVLEVAME